jgi:hypothetical protein
MSTAEATQTLELLGQTYRLLFTNVVRRDTTRSYNRHHDDRDEFPAWVWVGDLTITNLWFANKVTRPFRTDAFWQGHVRGLEFEDILFLVLSNRYLYRFDSLEVISKVRIIDHLARTAVEAYVFNRDQSIFVEPLRFLDHDEHQGVLCLEPQPVHLKFKKIVPTEEMVPVG